MIRKMLYKKIAVASTLLLVILMLYLIPSNNDVFNKTTFEYIYPNEVSSIYLLDKYNNVTRATISVSADSILSKASNLIEGLTINGKEHAKIPDGFEELIPEGTRVIDIDIKDKILIVNFSDDFNNIKINKEEKLIEALTYTLTSIDGIDKIELLINGKKLDKLPNSKKILPKYLDKNYGINKLYELTSLDDLDSYTLYYVLNYNDNSYYTPVTKYVNNKKQDKVKIIIDELAGSLSYQSNLVSYLDSNIKLIDYELMDNTIRLEFNDLILSDITNNLILEEVMYSVGLSLQDEFAIDDVIFMVENKEIATFSQKGIEKK